MDSSKDANNNDAPQEVTVPVDEKVQVNPLFGKRLPLQRPRSGTTEQMHPHKDNNPKS
eukprot:CAMPEP_0168552092 /NCGR_PEP_ID=MMETSP0413-20121227/6532_1 /TAXON_ID=136452 /ORGANISM="Filamoeba nolandi, Strain NC-AS-23-1" /LENGTH=57 /DNA_ID=CAMNT_0008582683 /DNA_START=91 /DNA_END=264 /DNA_ORIENTATION=-